MDLLSRRYASPIFMLEQMISYGRFSEFVSSLYKFDNDTKLWEIYLHKIHNKSFEEFKNSIMLSKPSNEKFETTIINSFNLLQEFNPESEVD